MTRITLTLLCASAVTLGAPDQFLTAPNPEARPVDQLSISGNACGPAALLNAIRFGENRWREVDEAIPAESDRGRMSYIIRAHGLRPSAHVEGRLRWERQNGINLLDLNDVGNELCAGRILPKLHHEVLVRGDRETDRKLLRRAHAVLSKSLRRGLPPIVSLRRMARPAEADPGTPPAWRVVHGHYVVITAVPAKLPRDATRISFHYLDPWGGRLLEGTLWADPGSGYPSLVAVVPESRVGRPKLRSGESSLISLSAVIGAF